MIYIDFDGVILDTQEILFHDWIKIPNHKNLPETEKIKYIQNRDWDYILNNSNIINDSVYHLKNMDYNKTAILTKIHSIGNEGYSKVKWIRDNNIKQNIILVPYPCKKSDVVVAKDNILIDDCLKNLTDWINCDGTGIFFDIDNDNYDSWNQPNNKGYQKVLSLSKIDKLERK